jgi:GntR family transcriptional regulator/MocR family aminotransferase
VDLHLDRLPPVRPGANLADALRAAFRDGRLAAESSLPSTRALAADLGLARGTVTAAYGQLAAEGYLVVRQGASTRVAVITRTQLAAPGPVARPAGPHPRWPVRWSLMPGQPDVSAFPRDVWLPAVRRVLARVPSADLGYPEPMGHPVLRRALAGYLGRTRGVVTTPGQVVVGSGFTALLGLWCGALHHRGITSVAFEDPSLPHLRSTAVSAGLAVVGVPVDDDGARVDLINAPAVVLTPAHQYPLGVTLSPARRAELSRQAVAGDVAVLEDDYDGEFRFDRAAVGAVQALAPGQVGYAGTASKVLAPGLRLAWLALPERQVGPLRDRMLATGASAPPVLDQLALADLLESGAYDRQVRRARARYRARRDAVLDAVAPYSDLVVPGGIAAGLHMHLRVVSSSTEAAIAAAARRHGLGIDLLGRHRLLESDDPETRPPGLLVGYAAPPDHAFAPALAALIRVLNDLRCPR